jgi:cytochrome P450
MDWVLDTLKQTPLSENELRFLGGVLMEGGSDTSSSLILTIIQAMTKYPEVQAKYAKQVYYPNVLKHKSNAVVLQGPCRN